MRFPVAAREAAPLAASPASGHDFSLVLGGPLFQLLRRGRLSDDGLGLVRRRIAFFVLVTWLPLLALSAMQGTLVGARRTMPFLHDLECHLRFLVAVPLLILAELVVHRRILPLIEQFRIRGLVRPAQLGRFAEAVNEALRLRNAVIAEVLMVVLVYGGGVLVIWRKYIALRTVAWYASPAPGGEHLSAAGLWFVFVSLPVFQFLLCRWYFRLFIWAKFLWRVSRLDLNLEATHPDKTAGLGFLSQSLYAFALVGAAHGVLLAGILADRIFYAGGVLTGFQLEVFVALGVVLILFVGPLMVFSPVLARVKRAGLREYGALAQTYVGAFGAKWLRGGAPPGEALIGSADIQSLADMGNSFAIVEQMRITPLSRGALIQFALTVLAPIVPLALTLMPAEKLIRTLVQVVL